jgi:hypothetical protein
MIQPKVSQVFKHGFGCRESWTVTFGRSNGNAGCHWLLSNTSDEKDRAREDGGEKRRKKISINQWDHFFKEKEWPFDAGVMKTTSYFSSALVFNTSGCCLSVIAYWD